MSWLFPTEREKWASPTAFAPEAVHLGLPALDARSRDLYGRVLPRGVRLPRFVPDRPPQNRWMAPHRLASYAYLPGQIILGKFAGHYLGYLDDRPQVTIAGARAGKTSTVLEPNLCLYPGSMLILDPKAELARTARLRQSLGHRVHILDPFGQSGGPSARFNPLDELDPDSETIVDDVVMVTHALIIDDGDARSRHWNDSARALLTGIILFTLTLKASERHLITVRELLSLTYAPLLRAARVAHQPTENEPPNADFFEQNKASVTLLLRALASKGDRFGGILAAIGNRFLATPPTERGSVFSTAAAQTDFLDSLPLRKISRWSDFKLADLRGERPMTLCLCLPVGRMESQHRWLRMIVQMVCLALEQLGPYPRERPPILFMMEEFACLGHMEIMERAAAYFPGFGVKLWAVLQDITQLQRYYHSSWETFLGNAGLVQCFANGDQATLTYLAERLDRLIVPFEIRTTVSRERFSQMLLIEGEPPALAIRLDHADVAIIRQQLEGEISR